MPGVSRGPGEGQERGRRGAGVGLSPRERQEWVKAPRAGFGVQRCLPEQSGRTRLGYPTGTPRGECAGFPSGLGPEEAVSVAL